MNKDKRQHIMQAAERLFTSRRFHEVTTDDVARAAKVGKGTIYRYFADKDDLFFQSANSGFDDLLETLRLAAPRQGAFRQQLLEACQAISTFFEGRRKLFRLMQAGDGNVAFKGALRSRFQEKRQTLLTALADVIGRGVVAGQIRSDVPPATLAVLLLGMMRARARDLPTGGPELPLESLIDFFCRGAAAPAVERPGAPAGT